MYKSLGRFSSRVNNRVNFRPVAASPGTGKFGLNGTDRPFGDHSGAEENGHASDPAVKRSARGF
jgi:hypothetical protein